MAIDPQDIRAIVRAIADDPEAKAELSRLLSSDELRGLSVEVGRLAEGQRATQERLDALAATVQELAEAQRAIQQQLAELVQAQRAIQQQLAALALAQANTQEELRSIVDRVGGLTGFMVEHEYRVKGPARFSKIARRLRPLTYEEIDTILDPAVQRGALGEAQAEDARLADVILCGRTKENASEVYLVVEASALIDAGDVERALRRAGLLARAGVETVPVVAGMGATKGATEYAHTKGVWKVTDGRSESPDGTVLTDDA